MICHLGVSAAAASGELKWLHKSISNLKALLLGTYHGRYSKLQPYLNEFCFRLDRRSAINQLYSRLAHAVVASSALLS